MSVEVFNLARGGTLIKTPSGSLQIGAPPETIKDALKILGEVPDTFVIPNRMFSADRGVSLADFEFPFYYNFFLKKRSIKLIGMRHQIETILRVLREAVLGPDNIQLVREYPYGINRDLIPNLRAEMDFLRPFSLSGKRKAELNDMATGIQWGPDGRVPFGEYALERSKESLKVVDGTKILAEVSLDIGYGTEPPNTVASKPFEPPLFGVTVIGSGSGFDPEEKTSGYILWVNRRGILVDPPVDSTHWLRAMDINPRLVDDCILTHCHADHDSGILQKLLEEKKINLYTTETIMESFVRKYQSLTGLNYKTFMNLFHFHPITLQVPIRINGGEFRFFYTLHSIPTIGFEVYFQGKSFVYSSDSLYDPETFKKLFERGDVNRYRMIELTNFPWHHSVIFHEAGIPPLHTPICNLVELPEPVRKRIYLTHTSNKSIPADSGLRKAPDGRIESIVIPVSPPPSNEALEFLDVLNHIDLFSGLPIEKAREFLTLVKVEHFKLGDFIIRKDTVGDRFFMIVHGRARVEREGHTVKTYSNNDYIGETSMILNLPRNADVIAETDMKVLVMDKYDFLYFIRGSEIARQMKIIAQNREYDTWSLFDSVPLLKSLSPTQRTQLQGIMARVRFKKGDIIVGQGTTRDNYFFVDSGIVSVERYKKPIIRAARGSFIAKIYATPRRGVHRFSMVAEEETVLYTMDVMEFYRFLEKNPGVFLTLREARIRDTIQSA
ncbi:MAG: cAMP/cGMP-dependent 3',5'-cyclic-AMP/GMP phosphodiesterase [Candidatus Rifleibacteriota bacterium]